jgi:hypothetical protein
MALRFEILASHRSIFFNKFYSVKLKNNLLCVAVTITIFSQKIKQ